MVDVVQETIELKTWQEERDDEIRKRDLDLRASEMQQQQMFQQSLLQQQHQFQQQQQQALNMSLMSALTELLKRLSRNKPLRNLLCFHYYCCFYIFYHMLLCIDVGKNCDIHIHKYTLKTNFNIFLNFIKYLFY